MIEKLGANLVKLKQEFAKIYDGTSHVQEVIPASSSELFPIDKDDLESLHLFANKNPIYYNSFEKQILDTSCIVYEGDINKYWLNSIQQNSSYAPFSPTWILSAYVISKITKNLGYRQAIDIGSGDGRIAYCSKVLGLDSYSIEIDNMLVDLQNSISEGTNILFNPLCHDSLSFDYSSLNLTNPIFFIGGLAQMGGNALATGVIENSGLKKIGMVFAGTNSQKYPADPKSKSGWGTIIEKNNLEVITELILPTVWTFREPDDTPYIFTKYSQ